MSELPKVPGVYLMKDDTGRVLYVGKAKDLRSRVGSYFQPSADLLNTRGPDICRMVDKVVDIDHIECDSEVDALIKEARLIKDVQPPHNVMLKDDKTFPYIEITTSDDFPAVYVTRTPRHKGTKLYGPFISGSGIRDAVNALQRVFKYRTCELEIHEGDDSRRFFRPCLLHAIDQCTAPCAALISKEEYRKDIDRLKRFFASKRNTVLRQLTHEMEEAAADLRYEEAAKLRDRVKAIKTLALSGDVHEHVQPEVFYVDPRAGLQKLADLLGFEAPPRRMECIDIAHLQGEAMVGSLICFIDGKPFKPSYRRFRIKTVEGVDDYAAIREVIVRRYRYAAQGEELYPDVILIDGGLGQLHAGLEAFSDMELRPPMVISLAKREEEVYIQAKSAPVRLARNNAALRLLQHMRDEAHRFAQHYHHTLRKKKTFDKEKPPRRP
ncbi:MAG: excinuclease ABC subunit UvrC [Planctomycetes bacterium]|nr:excinuclease ABC subunit UvrC [Planctomycetota bacterium]